MSNEIQSEIVSIQPQQIELDLQLGSALVFLSPRQFHSANAIFSSLLKPAADFK